MGLKQVMHLKPYTDRNLHDNHQLTLEHSVTCQLFKKKNQPNKQPTYPGHFWTTFFWTTASFHYVFTTGTIYYLNSYPDFLHDLKNMAKRIQLCYIRLHEKMIMKWEKKKYECISSKVLVIQIIPVSCKCIYCS